MGRHRPQRDGFRRNRRQRVGGYADLLLFDPATVIDTATYEELKRCPARISHVFVNGVAVVSAGRHTGARPAKALRCEIASAG